MATLWGGRTALEEALAEAASKAQASRIRAAKGQKPVPGAKVMSREQAIAIAVGVDGFDSRIVAGRLME